MHCAGVVAFAEHFRGRWAHPEGVSEVLVTALQELNGRITPAEQSSKDVFYFELVSHFAARWQLGRTCIQTLKQVEDFAVTWRQVE